jgi:hypothetical protein
MIVDDLLTLGRGASSSSLRVRSITSLAGRLFGRVADEAGLSREEWGGVRAKEAG